MRSIDADALTKEFEEKCAYECAICKYSKDFAPCKLIDNAPTVRNEYMRGYEAAEREYKRPQGEWTTVKGIEGAYYCSECDGDIDWKSRYCPWCGAKMEVDYE